MDNVLLTVLIYLFILFCIVIVFCRKQNIESYFLNKKSTSLRLMVFSNVATLVGAGASVAVISEAYKGSLAMGFVNISTFIFAIIILGFLASKIKKLGEKYGISTIVDYFYVRFDQKNKIIMTIFQLALLITRIGIQVMAITVLVSEILNIPYLIALGIVAVVCLTYSMIGGIKADFILDFIQFWVMLAVFLVMGIVAYQHTDLLAMLHTTPSEMLNPFAYKGAAWAIMGMIMMTTAYVSSSPYWQKIFSAKSATVAKKSFFYAAPLVLVLTLIILFLGLYAYHTLSGLDNADKAMFILINELLPRGAGIGFAAIIATVTSSLDSMFVAGSTIIYREFVSEKEKSITKARMITLGFWLLGILITLLFSQVIDLGIFYMSLAVLPATAVIMSFIKKDYSANASFYSILISMICLIVLYPVLWSNTLMITTPLSVIIGLSYESIAKIVQKRIH